MACRRKLKFKHLNWLTGKLANPLTQKGFTLIELLLVIMIFGMILTAVVPVSVKSFRSLQLTSTAGRVVVVMRYAQNRAIIEKRIYKIDFNAQESCYSVSAAGRENSENFKTIKNSLLSKKKLPDNLKIESLFIKQEDFMDKQGSSIYLYPDGSMDETELVLVSSLNEKIVIITMLSGKIKIIGE